MILLRSTFPRYRYDQLMLLCWTSIFPTEWLYFYVCFIIAASLYCYNKINESINECLNEIHGMYGMRTEWGEAIDEIDPLITEWIQCTINSIQRMNWLSAIEWMTEWVH